MARGGADLAWAGPIGTGAANPPESRRRSRFGPVPGTYRQQSRGGATPRFDGPLWFQTLAPSRANESLTRDRRDSVAPPTQPIVLFTIS